MPFFVDDGQHYEYEAENDGERMLVTFRLMDPADAQEIAMHATYGSHANDKRAYELALEKLPRYILAITCGEQSIEPTAANLGRMVLGHFLLMRNAVMGNNPDVRKARGDREKN